MTNSEEYDEETCITAMELRVNGIPVEDSIPDCAWIRRSAVKFRGGKVTGLDATGALKIEQIIEFTEPFHYFQVSVVRESDGSIVALES